MKRKITMAFALILVVLVLVFVFGPRPDGSFTLEFDPQILPNDLDAYLRKNEAAVHGLKPGSEKEIRWFDDISKKQSEIALVYLHGYSATKHEIRPLPDLLASNLEANLYYTRLKGHGSSGDALAKATFNDWVNDYLETMAIARRLGKKVIIVSTSTGSTLATWALATLPGAQKDIAAHIMFSPNYELAGVSTFVMNLPHGQSVFPFLLGKTRSWTAKNDEQERWWTTSYPTLAILPMAALLRETQKAALSSIDVPSLVFYSNEDQVVSVKAIKETLSRFNTSPDFRIVSASGDPSSHVHVGDIVSPQNNEWALDEMRRWLKATLTK